MTDKRRPIQPDTMRCLTWGALLLTGALLQGCAQTAGGAGGPGARVFAADFSGAAKSCDVPKVEPVAGQTTDAAVKMVNDGGWCGLPVRQDGSKPYDAGLLTGRPAHGNVLIHTVGNETRIDYTPDRGFAGTDGFSVKLVPGDATIRVAVTVAARA
jgi:hypothetical protein